MNKTAHDTDSRRGGGLHVTGIAADPLAEPEFHNASEYATTAAKTAEGLAGILPAARVALWCCDEFEHAVAEVCAKLHQQAFNWF